ncbi:hypothetical protein D3C80_1461790 [compost metagenome]
MAAAKKEKEAMLARKGRPRPPRSSLKPAENRPSSAYCSSAGLIAGRVTTWPFSRRGSISSDALWWGRKRLAAKASERSSTASMLSRLWSAKPGVANRVSIFSQSCSMKSRSRRTIRGWVMRSTL